MDLLETGCEDVNLIGVVLDRAPFMGCFDIS
jgi:hypothetical protein